MSLTDDNFDVLTTTAIQLRELLEAGRLTSVQIVSRYLLQISNHNDQGLGLRAMLCVAPQGILMAQAAQLDAERAKGAVRGPLHGIPIVLKDVFMTSPALGMPTTAGAVAFKDCYAHENTTIVDQLLDAGLLILGKASMTEFCGLKATCMTAGWNALKGQTQSAWIPGGVQSTDLFMGRSTPGGSSSGSAVAVSAGFAPLALGTETSGSVCMPANRAGLYSLKASLGTVDVNHGVFRLTKEFDCVGAMARWPEDLHALMKVLMASALEQVHDSKWSSVRVGFVDPNTWDALQFQREGMDIVQQQIIKAYQWAMEQIQLRGGFVHYPVELPKTRDLQYQGRSAMYMTSNHEFQSLLADFCSRLENPSVRSLRDLVAFNVEHASRAMPEPHVDQNDLLKVFEDTTSPETVTAAISHARHLAGPLGIDRTLTEQGIDLIIGPGDCSICVVAALAGYPTAMVPLGRLAGEYGMGQPQGLMIVGGRGAEGKMLALMTLWRDVIGDYKIPTLFDRQDGLDTTIDPDGSNDTRRHG